LLILVKRILALGTPIARPGSGLVGGYVEDWALWQPRPSAVLIAAGVFCLFGAPVLAPSISAAPEKTADKKKSEKANPAGKQPGSDKGIKTRKGAAKGMAPERLPKRRSAAQPREASDAQVEAAPEVLQQPGMGQAWSQAEIDAALAQCDTALAGIKGKFVIEPPLRAGVCGTPAPVHVSSLGSEPEVQIQPPVEVTCPLARALGQWIAGQLQPAASGAFESPIVKIETMSSYACRNRYGDTTTKLSEHAAANAVDIGAVVTADGRRIEVLAHWGAQVRRSKVVANLAGGATSEAATASAQPEPVPEPGPEESFLRALHRSACTSFGTVLGPDANEAHSNHLHLDLAHRKRENYCR
jgi:hypothetical protein